LLANLAHGGEGERESQRKRRDGESPNLPKQARMKTNLAIIIEIRFILRPANTFRRRTSSVTPSSLFFLFTFN